MGWVGYLPGAVLGAPDGANKKISSVGVTSWRKKFLTKIKKILPCAIVLSFNGADVDPTLSCWAASYIAYSFSLSLLMDN